MRQPALLRRSSMSSFAGFGTLTFFNEIKEINQNIFRRVTSKLE